MFDCFNQKFRLYESNDIYEKHFTCEETQENKFCLGSKLIIKMEEIIRNS